MGWLDAPSAGWRDSNRERPPTPSSSFRWRLPVRNLAVVLLGPHDFDLVHPGRATTLLGVSVDFYVWRGPKLSAREFEQRLIDMDELELDEASFFESSDRLLWFRGEVLARFPALEDLADDDRSTPWAFTPAESTRLIELNFGMSATEDQVLFIFQRALLNGLYIYDAQTSTIAAPGAARWQIWLRKIGLGSLAGPDR